MEVKKRYKKTEVGVIPEEWYVKPLYALSKMKSGESITAERINEAGRYKCYGGNGLRGYTNSYTHNGNYALIGRQGALCGNVQFVSDTFFASEHAVVVTPKDDVDILWLYNILGRMNLNRYSESSAQPGLSVSKIILLPVATPSTKQEQTAIANALSDADALISSLVKLIAKKRNIKQGAMQQLLQPKEGWEVKKLGGIADIQKGEQLNRETLAERGAYPVYNGGTTPSGYSDKWNTESGTIIISEGGNSCGFVNFIPIKFWRGGHCYKIETKLNKTFAYQLLKFREKEIMALRVGSGLPNIQRTRLTEFAISFPEIEEQIRIAEILENIDNEISALEAKLEKYKQIKQGMMQQLLTGKIRLIKQNANVE